MAQIINDNNGIGAVLGGGLGTGLGTALNSLAQNKLQNLLQRQQARRTAPGLASLGIPEQEAQQIAMLPEQLQSLVIKNYLQAAENAGLDQALKQLSGEELPPQSGLPLEMLSEVPTQKPQNPLASMQEVGKSLKKQEGAAPQGRQAPKTVAELLKSPRLTPEHKLKLASLEQQKQFHKEKLSAKEQQEVDKETKPYYDEIAKGYKAAKENNIRLERMEELINRGKLNAPFWVSTLENLKEGFKIPVIGGSIALDLSAALHPDTQEFQKLSTDFVKTAKDYFGSRLTDTDLNTFLKTIPNVAQSDEGKRRVIQNLKSFNEIALLRKKAADQIIKENGGKRPSNFDSLVDERIESQVDQIAKKFKSNNTSNESIIGKIPLVGGLSRALGII